MSISDPATNHEDGWIQLKPLNSGNFEGTDDAIVSDQKNKLNASNDDVNDFNLDPLDPITESSNYSPINGDPRPRSENDNAWNSQRKPWLPDISKDIRPFEDLFGNVIDNSFADARKGAASIIKLNSNIFICIIISVLVILHA